MTYPPLDPPICDPRDGALLADGSFLNNVPGSVSKSKTKPSQLRFNCHNAGIIAL